MVRSLLHGVDNHGDVLGYRFYFYDGHFRADTQRSATILVDKLSIVVRASFSRDTD
jgi:hypothetical protein